MAITNDLESSARLREQLGAYHDSTWQAGSAEPWIAQLVASLLRACDARNAIEIGGFQGYTSRRLAAALGTLSYPATRSLTVCEIDPTRAALVDAALAAHGPVQRRVVIADSHSWIPTLPDASVDFVWLDGNHEHLHVGRELDLLAPKLRIGGLVCGHDVFGVCDLQREFVARGGYALDLPRLGPAGGVGLWQRRV